jgi:DNA-binding response OmpR family regulator
LVPRRILSLSANYGLLLTRNDLLAVAGYSVASPRRPEDAHMLFSGEVFDVVLIGDSVPPPTRKQIIRELRAIRAEVPIIYVYVNQMRRDEPLADECVDVSHDPQPLLQAIERSLKRSSRRAA